MDILTVKDLITKLSAVDPSKPVYISDNDTGWDMGVLDVLEDTEGAIYLDTQGYYDR